MSKVPSWPGCVRPTMSGSLARGRRPSAEGRGAHGTGDARRRADAASRRFAPGRVTREDDAPTPRRLANPPGPGISGRRATARGYGRAVCCATREVAGGARRAVVGHTRLRRWLFCALASVVVACGGDSATAPSPPLPNQAPVATGTIPAQTLFIGETGTVNVSGYFNDPGGDALTYSASSSDASVATVTVSGSTLTVTPVTQGMATVTVTARDPGGLSAQQSFTVTVPNRPPEVLITVTPDTITTDEAIEFSPPVSEWFIDPDGDALTYAASSSDTAVALANLTDGELTVWSVAAGTTTITVTATDPGELSAELSFQVTVTTAGQSPVIITSVEPEVLVEGEAATITGTGFSTTGPDNLVSIGGLAATVTSASETSLSIMVPRADCLPPRREELRVSVADESEGFTLGVVPGTSDDLIAEDGYYVTRAGDGCVQLPGDGAGGEYLIGVMSTSETVSSLTSVTLNGTPGDATVFVAAGAVAVSRQASAAFTRLPSRRLAPSSRAPSVSAQRSVAPEPSLPRRDYAAHNRIMARNQELMRQLGPSTLQSSARAAQSHARAVAVGDTVALNVPDRSGSDLCSEFIQVSAVVRQVGEDIVWLDDLENPTETFTDSELESLGVFYSRHTNGVHDDYFGGLSDVDRNGQVLVLMTKEVNRKEGTLGFVFGADLFSHGQCAGSNEAEVFYGFVPDPDGIFGSARTKDDVDREYPSLLTHEITHIVQFAAIVFGSARNGKAIWEMEGGATLAEQLVGYRIFGHGSGQDLGWEEFLLDETGTFYSSWVNQMSYFFGLGPNGTRIAGAPEQCSWVGGPEEGNTGPCISPETAVYGVPSMVLRFMMDFLGDGFPGGEEALMRRMTQSPQSGFASLMDVASLESGGSVPIEPILSGFYIALALELLEELESPAMSSWDLRDIFSNFPPNAQLQPYLSNSASPQIDASIRAGSSLYFHWTPDGSLSPTSIKVTSADGNPIPGHIAVWAAKLP